MRESRQLWARPYVPVGWPSTLEINHLHTVSHLFSPFTFEAPAGPLTLPNRIVIAPMCQYSSQEGRATDWHLAHWAQLLNSGAGMLTLEATAVSPEARITPGCLGLWDDVTAAALQDMLQRARRLAPPMPVCAPSNTAI